MRDINNFNQILNLPETESEIKNRSELFRKGEEFKLRMFDFMGIVQNPGYFTRNECKRVLQEMNEFERELDKYFKKLRKYMSGRMFKDE